MAQIIYVLNTPSDEKHVPRMEKAGGQFYCDHAEAVAALAAKPESNEVPVPVVVERLTDWEAGQATLGVMEAFLENTAVLFTEYGSITLAQQHALAAQMLALIKK